MRENTCFSEKANYTWQTPGKQESVVMFEDGLYSRYGIEALVWELNANWNGRTPGMPTQYDWVESGEGLNEVFYKLFTEETKSD